MRFGITDISKSRAVPVPDRPDKRGMSVVVTLFIAPCRAVETPYLRFFLFLLCVFNGFLFIFFLLPFILFLQTLFLFLVLLFLFRPGCVKQTQCTRNEEKGIMNMSDSSLSS